MELKVGETILTDVGLIGCYLRDYTSNCDDCVFHHICSELGNNNDIIRKQNELTDIPVNQLLFSCLESEREDEQGVIYKIVKR